MEEMEKENEKVEWKEAARGGEKQANSPVCTQPSHQEQWQKAYL